VNRSLPKGTVKRRLLDLFLPQLEEGLRKYVAFIYVTLVVQALLLYLLLSAHVTAEIWADVVKTVQIALIAGFFGGNAIAHGMRAKSDVAPEMFNEDVCGACGQTKVKLPVDGTPGGM